MRNNAGASLRHGVSSPPETRSAMLSAEGKQLPQHHLASFCTFKLRDTAYHTVQVSTDADDRSDSTAPANTA